MTLWILYNEDPHTWHAVPDDRADLLCGRLYEQCEQGPWPEEPPGTACTECRARVVPSKVTKFQELSDEQLVALGPEELRTAYQDLREHHVKETTQLIRKLRNVDNR